MKAKSYAVENPAFTRAGLAGVETNHSSTTPSVTEAEDHAQSDDALQDVPPPQDPNISGKPETKQLHPWRAGALSAWQENDDYRKFFEAGKVSESATTHRHETVHDLDYDDNHGIPLAIGEHYGLPGEANAHKYLEEGTQETAKEFPLGPVIVRRI